MLGQGEENSWWQLVVHEAISGHGAAKARAECPTAEVIEGACAARSVGV